MRLKPPPAPTTMELLAAIEQAGCAITLELGGTSLKWVSGKNLFLGLTDPQGTRVRDAYGPVRLEVDLRAKSQLQWQQPDGQQVANLTEALRNTIQMGNISRRSPWYQALSLISQFVPR